MPPEKNALKTLIQMLPLLNEALCYFNEQTFDERDFIRKGVNVSLNFFHFSLFLILLPIIRMLLMKDIFIYFDQLILVEIQMKLHQNN